MGELKTFNETWTTKENSVSVYPWGLTCGRVYDEDYFNSVTYFLTSENLEEIQLTMLNNMQWLYRDDPKLTEALFHTRHFKEHLLYLEENGFQVYGAVATGPIKELLKLRELDEIHGVELSEIARWNWVE